MSKKLFVVIGIVVAFFLMGSLTASAQDIKGKTQPMMIQKDIDLAADIQIQIISKANDYSGRIRVIGIVKNVGKQAYQSKPNQQTLYLYMTDAAGNNITKTLGQKSNFTLVKPGQALSLITYVMDWNTSQEFGPGFKASIVFDPDIAADGNKANDDQYAPNNLKSLSNDAVNHLFKSQNPIPKTPVPPKRRN
jgi:archaellum component FlaG (FlaF/FlaG flagellin family)